MAGSDSQKPLLTLIRDFTTEKSQGGKNHRSSNYSTDLLSSLRWDEGFHLVHLQFSFIFLPLFFFLWYDFAERRIVNQKKRIEELKSELDAVNAELEGAKRGKETAEQELKGYEIKSSMNEASLQALEV